MNERSRREHDSPDSRSAATDTAHVRRDGWNAFDVWWTRVRWTPDMDLRKKVTGATAPIVPSGEVSR